MNNIHNIHFLYNKHNFLVVNNFDMKSQERRHSLYTATLPSMMNDANHRKETIF